jgi:hypothetical protein
MPEVMQIFDGCGQHWPRLVIYILPKLDSAEAAAESSGRWNRRLVPPMLYNQVQSNATVLTKCSGFRKPQVGFAFLNTSKKENL